ncbi:Spo0E family sporulation regulatory protein-aspartic acid phosphatase [uncultured Clostridium sp.]|uniref:Spo0E family sporulation regulatory protein-aspartic acid phosphatase n=1 Tax=uncultured Clostridium sp. TaxID=59620 RepID=UPI0025FEEF15|nr:Spo0E family sporulation regulatory protein-aspartic acid phosphatase [uncultured Clostridium sp.]
MNFLILNKLKFSIFIRKQLINILLIFLYPTTDIMVALSQDLDKYIVLYQKKLFSIYIHNNSNSNKLKKFAA